MFVVTLVCGRPFVVFPSESGMYSTFPARILFTAVTFEIAMRQAVVHDRQLLKSHLCSLLVLQI
jgi:hypothetical protein